MVTLERAVFVGAVMTVLGVLAMGAAFWLWVQNALGQLNYARVMQLLIPAVTVLALSIQIVMASFLSGILDLKVTK